MQENEGTEDQQIITAYVNANPTKLAYEEVVEGGGAGMTSTWQNGDHFLAIQDGEKVVDFQLISGAGTTQGVFQTRTSGVTSTTQWVGVVGNGAEAHSSEIHCPYMGQNGTIKSLGGFNYVKVTATGEEPYFNFAEGEGLSYVIRVKLPEGVKCIEYTPCGYGKVTSSAVSQIDYNDNDQNDYSQTSTITLGSTSASGDCIYISLPLLNYSRTRSSYANGEQYGNLKAGVIITLLNNDSDNADQSTGLVFEDNVTGKGGLIKTLDMSSMALIHRTTPSEAVLFSKTGDIQCKLHDSALTQKATEVNTYWSPCNLGASKPSEVGGYFALGEYEYGKSTYTFPSYTLRHQTKSTNRDDMLSVDFKISGKNYRYTMCGSRYDAARVLWGQAWRMPHMIEAYAASNGNCSRTTLEGVAGIQFNGTTPLFIPNSRYMDGDKLNDATTPRAGDYKNDNYDCARFWSGDQLNRSYSEAGWNEVFTFGNTKDTSTDYDYWRRSRYLGFPIRPVLASSVIK